MEVVTVLKLTMEILVDLVEGVSEEEILQVLEYHLVLDLGVLQLVVKVIVVVLEILLHLYILVEVVEEQVLVDLLEHLLKVEMVEMV